MNYKKISDFPQYRNRIIGYFNARIFRLEDLNAELLYIKFEKCSFVIPDFPPGNLDLWLRYQAHIFLLDELKNRSDIFYKLYIELIYNFNPFYKKAEFEHYKIHFPEQLFFNLEFSTASLRTLVSEAGYPNRVLCYCFKYLLTEWPSIRIANELSTSQLDEALDLLKKEYSEESGIHKLFIDYMFLPLRKSLNSTLNDCIQQYGSDNESFLQITKHILNTRIGSTKLEDYFGAKEHPKRAHMVSVWCERVKKTLIRKTVAFLKDQRYYIKA
ncbi:hypothetical protein [Acetivibrio cellulolyticus]|uniref:hypothetical protein n=1 Tax=Acetivibrio cellulolyticus TaxID=35830 RepID=UPI0001E2D081|nr:hypothetical protein [Acetivibrio cellulolyticus]